jgi:hypothetical protein
MNEIFINNLKKLTVQELFRIYHSNPQQNKDLIIKEVENRINKKVSETPKIRKVI